MYNKMIKIIALSIVFTLIIGLSPMSFAATGDRTVNLNVSKKLDRTKILLDEEFEIKYQITPEEIAGETPPPKEIFIVMDTSGSMDFNLAGKTAGRWEQNRMTIASQAANKFLDNLKGKSGVKVGLVSYENLGHVKKELTTDIESVKREVNKLNPLGGTNIGDGLRQAYYRLINADISADKYIILLTDGEPTYHSVKNTYWYGHIIHREFYYDEGTAPDYYGGGSVITDNDKNYCYAIAENFIKSSSIQSYMIAFTKSSNGDVLKEVARKAGGEYEKAEDADALQKVYDKIYQQIAVDFTVGVKFEESLPEGLTVVSAPEGFNIDGQNVTGDIDIDYTFNSSSNRYKAEKIEFTIKVKGSRAGNYSLNSSKLSYKDLDDTNKSLSFGNRNIEVVALRADINTERSLSKQEMLIDEHFNVNYKILPKEFVIADGLEPPAELVVKNVNFSEQFPEGLTVVSAGGLNKSGRYVSGNLGDIVYRYNASDGKYKTSPIEFSITLKGKEGEYALGRGADQSKITYSDLDKETKEKNFAKLNPSVVKYGMPKLEVTEIKRRGEVVDITLKATLPAHTKNGTIMKPTIETDVNGNIDVKKENGGVIATIDGKNEVCTKLYTYTGLSIYETHRVWLESVSDFDPNTRNSTDVLTIFNAININ